MPKPEPIVATRIVASPEALDGVRLAPTALALRTAPDELLVVGGGAVGVDDPYAIVLDDGGWSAVWMPSAEADPFLRSAAAWPMPDDRPGFAQGMLAGLPVKLWLEDTRVLFVVASGLAAEFWERSP